MSRETPTAGVHEQQRDADDVLGDQILVDPNGRQALFHLPLNDLAERLTVARPVPGSGRRIGRF